MKKTRREKLAYFRKIINEKVREGYHVVISVDFKDKKRFEILNKPDLGYLYLFEKENDFLPSREVQDMIDKDSNMNQDPIENDLIAEAESELEGNVYRIEPKTA